MKIKVLRKEEASLVNPEGKIVVYEVNAGNVGRNAEELFRKLQASQFVAEHGDQVCPARWAPGAATLKPGIDLVGGSIDIARATKWQLG